MRNGAPGERPAGEPARKARSRSPAAGFTLIEVLIVAVLGSLILGATYQVLVTNQRIYSAQREQVQGHGTVRAGLEVLTQEIREASASGGDLVAMEPTSVEIRSMRALGFVCITDDGSSPPRFTLRPYGGQWDNQTPVFVFADNEPGRADDDVWLEGTISSVEFGEPCPGESGGEDRVRISVQGISGELEDNDVLVGAPVRTFHVQRYGIIDFEGSPYLGREVEGESQPLVGPLAPEDGLLLEYLDAGGDPTASADEVRRIRVTLRTRSGAQDAAGRAVADSITASVQLRN